MSDGVALRVSCECGKWLPVGADVAGSAVSCSCGRRVVVPLLEEFRGRPDLPSAATIERRVRMLITAGEIPPTEGCGRCGTDAATEVVPVVLECERYTARATGGQRFLILPFFSFLFWMSWREEERVEIRGRDTDVPAPVCLCGGCGRYFRGRPGLVYFGANVAAVAAGGMAGWFEPFAGLAAAAVGLLGVGVWRRLAFRSRQRGLKGILRRVPVYRQVLARYPLAVAAVPAVSRTA